MNTRRLVDVSNMTPRGMRQADLVGELLPAPGHDLVPWEEAEVLAQRNPERLAPIINVSFPRAQNGDAPGVMTWERRSLQREPSVESDFILPFLQSVGMAWAALVLSGLLAWAMGWPWKVPAVTFGLVLALALVARLRFMDSLLWSVETLTGHDMNGDGKVGQPAAFTLANPAQARRTAAQDVDATAQAAQRAELLAFLHRCYQMGTGERSHGVRASGSDREAYVRQRDVLLNLGIARWKRDGRPRAGWVMAVSHQRALDIIGRHVL